MVQHEEHEEEVGDAHALAGKARDRITGCKKIAPAAAAPAAPPAAATRSRASAVFVGPNPISQHPICQQNIYHKPT